jgi:hypothetical protein
MAKGLLQSMKIIMGLFHLTRNRLNKKGANYAPFLFFINLD